MAFDWSHHASSYLALHGETVTVTLADGSERVLTHDLDAGTYGAIVERVSESEPVEPGHRRPKALVSLLNSATLGLSTAELDTGLMRITFADRIGGAEVEHAIGAVVSQDDGLLVLEAV